MRRILRESYLQEVEEYLIGPELRDELLDRYGTSREGKEDEINQFIIDECSKEFENVTLPEKKAVQVLFVRGDDYEVVNPEYEVIQYNGKFYDYAASQFSEDIKIKIEDLPVIQPVLSNSRLISSTVSTVKGYVLIYYR